MFSNAYYYNACQETTAATSIQQWSDVMPKTLMYDYDKRLMSKSCRFSLLHNTETKTTQHSTF